MSTTAPGAMAEEQVGPTWVSQQPVRRDPAEASLPAAERLSAALLGLLLGILAISACAAAGLLLTSALFGPGASA